MRLYPKRGREGGEGERGDATRGREETRRDEGEVGTYYESTFIQQINKYKFTKL